METECVSQPGLVHEEYLTRCGPECFQSGVCQYRPEADGGPCPRELERYRRFVGGLVEDLRRRGISFTFEVAHLVVAAAMTDLLLDRCARYLATCGTFFEEIKNGARRGRAGDGCTEEERTMVKTQIQPLVDQMNKLYDRKHKVIRAVTSSCEAAVPEDDSQDMSLAEFMQMVMEIGKDDIYEAVRHSPGSEETDQEWSLPGDIPSARKK